MNIFPYTIRDATEADAESIAFVHVNSWKTSYTGIIDPSFLETLSYEKRLASWKEILQSKNTQQLVALFDDQVVGFAGFGPALLESCIDHTLLNDKTANIGEVYSIYLLEQHKGKGCGKALFNQCRYHLGQKGGEYFVVRALRDNIRAIHFYEREGGSLIGEINISIGEKSYPESFYLFRTEAL
ncbi:MAG: GNAT family N-acetyltransferase [Alphaproteobacteria bacterium]|nr:GNAT family N-acetyltransferase [Alphaproteobacteria bacterium]